MSEEKKVSALEGTAVLFTNDSSTSPTVNLSESRTELVDTNIDTEVSVRVSNNAVNTHRCGSVAWRIANGFMFVLLACCAGVQYNDPDLGLWIPLYGVPSLLFLSISVAPLVQTKIPWRVIAGLELVYCIAMLVYTVLYLTDFTSSIPRGDKPHNYEEILELVGIVIVSSWTTLTLFYNPNVIKKDNLSRCKTTLIAGGIISVVLLPILVWLICYVGLLAQDIEFCSLLCRGTHVTDR